MKKDVIADREVAIKLAVRLRGRYPGWYFKIQREDIGDQLFEEFKTFLRSYRNAGGQIAEVKGEDADVVEHDWEPIHPDDIDWSRVKITEGPHYLFKEENRYIWTVVATEKATGQRIQLYTRDTNPVWLRKALRPDALTENVV